MKFDILVIGGGPCGATAASELAEKGFKVALLDRAGRIKPCGGAIPPILIDEFDIPETQLVAKVNTARMISPSFREVDIPIENGFVGMVDREHFDEFLRTRAAKKGAYRLTGTFQNIDRSGNFPKIHYKDKLSGKKETIHARLVIGADGARSNVARSEIPNGTDIPYVIAYHEIISAPEKGANHSYDPKRCDVVYNGTISPDFYGWVFPHGKQASVGMGTGVEGVDLKKATKILRHNSGLEDCKTIRKEGAPIPLKPLEKWDNGLDVLVAGDAAGVVAPSSGEGIYYAMAAGKEAAYAANKFLLSQDVRDLALARKRFMKKHKTVFKVLGAMQNAYYRSDERRERFVSLCKDIDVQKITFESYMHKKLTRKRPLAHIKIMIKNVLHLTGLIKATAG
ncbi:MAG: geranylgeranyl diphosphate reductase [Paracoccaceae bacterium]